MKLLIRNLPRTTTEAEVRALFEAFGSVQSCTVVMDKASSVSKGFGFIEMPKPGEAKAAMKNLNGTELSGNTLRVKKAEPKSTDKAEEAPAATVQQPVTLYKKPAARANRSEKPARRGSSRVAWPKK